jgi:energy-coupling factor transport system permease protein
MSLLIRQRIIDRDAFFTRLDFRPKLFLMFCVTIVAFVWQSPIANGLLAALMGAMALASGVKWQYIRATLRLMMVLGIMLLVFHGFFNKIGVLRLIEAESLTPLFTLPRDWWLVGGVTLSLEGLLYGLNAFFATLAMFLVVPLTVFTTDTNNMIVALVRARVPYKFAFIFSSTLRFFPLLLEEVQTIIEAQRLRGLEIEEMSAFRKARVYGRVAVPLILGTLLKSQSLEIALQSRAFSGDPDRTYLHESTLGTAEYGVLAACALFLIGALIAYVVWDVGAFGWLLF